ncbi:MAG: ribose 5-phosphate isomerase B [Deltaproteobacteria bacterium]|nr:ribose 5-phosphate isomerase B [Deltaproteobacteria bacterium]
MKIALGADHAGFPLKQSLFQWLSEEGRQAADVGTFSAESCDYPHFAGLVAQEVLAGRADRGILICGTGVGMAMAANRFNGIRAANCTGLFCARMSREHNDSNVLALGAWVVGLGLAREIVRTWLMTPFEGGRHQPRLDLLDHLSPP